MLVLLPKKQLIALLIFWIEKDKAEYIYIYIICDYDSPERYGLQHSICKYKQIYIDDAGIYAFTCTKTIRLLS